MSLRVNRSTDRILVEHPIFLIVGLPGVCKSSLSYSADKPVSLNFDSESAQARAINRGDSINILTVEDLVELEQNGHPLINEATTIIEDTVGSCIELIKAAVLQNPKCGTAGRPNWTGWAAIQQRYKNLHYKFKTAGKNQLLIAHAKEREQDNVTFYRPQIDGGARDFVIQQADFVAFLHIVGKERILDFNPTESWHGKNPGQWPPLVVPPPEKARTFLSELMQKGREELGRISEASAAVAQVIETWKATIASYTKVEQFNSAIPEIKKLTQVQNVQVKKLMMDRAKELNITFDAEKVLFIAPTTEPVAAGF